MNGEMVGPGAPGDVDDRVRRRGRGPVLSECRFEFVACIAMGKSFINAGGIGHPRRKQEPTLEYLNCGY